MPLNGPKNWISPSNLARMASVCRAWRPAAVAIGGLAAVTIWSYWPTLAVMAKRWATDPQYSHGFLVPVFAAVVMAVRRPAEGFPPLSFSWWGVPWLASAALLRLAGAALYFDWFDAISLLPCVVGFVVLLGGWPALRWAWPAVLFLVFMLPLPYSVEVALAHPLQRLATVVSTYALQTLGVPALAEGNVILVEEFKLGVVEACSGLGMLVTFFALSTAFALVIDRPWPDRLVMFLSAVPIAVFANVCRITLTGWLYVNAGSGAARVVYHDLAGWLMMPLALGLMGLELWFIDHLLVSAEGAGPVGVPFDPTDAGPQEPPPASVPEERPAVIPMPRRDSRTASSS